MEKDKSNLPPYTRFVGMETGTEDHATLKGGLQGVSKPLTQHYTVVTIPSNEPPDHLVGSIFSMVYLNCCCLGLIALIYSVKARDRKMVGDFNGARIFGTRARNLILAARILSLLFVLLVLFWIAWESNYLL